MQIILLVDLAFDLALNTQTHNVWIALTGDRGRIGVHHGERLFKRGHAFSRVLFLLFDIVLEVARERLDLLDLLRKVRAQPAKLVDHICFDVPGFVRLYDGLLVKVAEETVRIVQAAVAAEQ